MDIRRLVSGCLLVLIVLLIGFYESLNAVFDTWRMRGCDSALEIDAYDLAVNPINGDLWGTSHEGLFRFDGGDWHTYQVSSLQSDYVIDAFIVFDPHGRMWQGGHDGIGIFDGANWTFYNEEDWGLPDTVVTSIAFDPTGKPWIGLSADIVAPQGTCGGISVWNDRWITYAFSDPSPMGLGCQNVQEIQFDPSGRAWVGLWNSSIVTLEKTRDEDFHAAIPGGPDFSLNTQSTGYFLIPQGALPVDDETGPVVIKDFYIKSQIYPLTYDDRLVDEIHSILFDPRGNTWINADDGLYRFTNGKLSLVRRPAGKIVIDPKGNVWSIGRGLSLYNGTNWKSYQAGDSCIGNENIQSIAFDKRGRAWVDLFPTLADNKFSLVTFDRLPPRIPDLLLRLRASFLPPANPVTRWIGPVLLGFVWLLIFVGAKWPALIFPLANISLAVLSERVHSGQYYSIWVFELVTLFSLGGGVLDALIHTNKDARSLWENMKPGLYGTLLAWLLLIIAGMLWRMFGPSS